ncbi:MAG: sialate O-acetylesterase [Pirellulales bacterium]|nr:sialate O-acetylesterase [Pirellulales bacterium]
MKRFLLAGMAILSSVAMAGTPVLADESSHLFILSGQSNMAGLNPSRTFTPAVKKALGNVKVVKSAQGGQPIRRWYKKWKPAGGEVAQGNGDLYDKLMKAVNYDAIPEKPDTVTFVWMQGERDAREKHGEVYAESMRGLIDQLKKDLGRDDINFVIGRLSDFGNDGKRYAHWNEVCKAQVDVAEADPRGAWVDTDDLNGPKDGLHYTKEGYDKLGERFAEKAIKLIQKKKTPETTASGTQS